METIKILALHNRYDYNQRVHLSEDARKELQWWLDEGLNSNKPLTRDRPVGIIKSGSSDYAWGAVMKNEVTHGMWSDEEKTEHINVLELNAAMLGVLSLCCNLMTVTFALSLIIQLLFPTWEVLTPLNAISLAGY